MLNKIHFEESLCQNAGLFSLSKTQADLFLLLQAHAVTYQQLALTGLHGQTEASGRLSLKRLEKTGLAQAKTLPDQVKYYCLTSRGKKLAKSIFPENYLEELQPCMERRLPGSPQQLRHRIRANDFYFTYVHAPLAHPCPWHLECPLPQSRSTGSPPRSDGFLDTGRHRYYVEQDNGTQSEAVLLQKINAYMDSGILSSGIRNATLVFCLAFPYAPLVTGKPAYSLYRTLLHLGKAWKLLEEEYRIRLDCGQFIEALKKSPLMKTVSAADFRIFKGIRAKHPEMESLSGLETLKKAYRHDSAEKEERHQELDLRFSRRCRSHFRKFYQAHPALLNHALAGNPLFAVPNHRLPLYQPYILPEEYLLGQHLLECLYAHGLNTDGWTFQSPLRIPGGDGPECHFRMGFCHRIYGYIAIENLTIDLSAPQRIRYGLSGRPLATPLILLLAAALKDLELLQDIPGLIPPPSQLTLLRLDTAIPPGQVPPPGIFSLQGEPVIFDCDIFDETIHIFRKEALSCEK